MEEYKKKIKNRQILLNTALLGTCSSLLLTRNFGNGTRTSDFIAGFQTGIAIGLLVLLIAFIVKYSVALKKEEQLKKLYISETDERKLLIHQKSGSIGMNITMFGLATATAIAGNFDDIVFFTLLGACLFVCLIRGVLKIYYFKKY